MKFTVLGKSPAWQDAGGACSSYLVEQDGFELLIDCGNGSFAELKRRTDYSALGAVLITHIHGDHILDLVPLAYALTIGPRAPSSRPPLWVPPGGLDKLRALVSIWGSDSLIDQAFDPREYELDAELELGPISIALQQVPHYTLTHAVSLKTRGSDRIVFGADCGPSPALTDFAAGASLLIAEATLRDASDEDEPPERRGHMSAADAAEIARRAGVGRLVLTHISDELDQEYARSEAARVFGGPVEIAATGSSWQL